MNIELAQENEHRRKAEEVSHISEARLNALLHVTQHKSESIQDILDNALHKAVGFTKSKIGFLYRYDEETQLFTLNSWSHEVMNACKVRYPQTVYHLKETGFWGEVVRQRKPIIENNFEAPNSLKKGYPEGHVPLQKYMSIPIFKEQKIVAVIGLANRENDYNEIDVEHLTLFMDVVWIMIENKLIDQKLKDYSHLNEKLINTSTYGILAYDNSGKCFLANESAAISVGATVSQLLNQNFREIDSWKKLGVIEIAEKVLGTGNSIKLETKYKTAFGKELWLECVMSQFELNNSPNLLLIFQDITDKVNAQEKLVESEKRFRKLFEDTSAALSLIENNKFIDCNTAALRIMGMSTVDEYKNHSPVDFSPEFQPDGKLSSVKAQEMIDLAFEKGSHQFEWKYIKKDGTEFWVEVFLTAIYYSDRKILHSHWRDITVRKNLELLNAQIASRVLRQRSALVKITTSFRSGADNFEDTIKKLTEIAAETIDVARTSVWSLNKNGNNLECIDLFESQTQKHSSGYILEAEKYPSYFSSIKNENKISADTAWENPKTIEFRDEYFVPLGITSTLDSSINVGGLFTGVVCFEHIGEKREWFSDEEFFATTFATIIAELFTESIRKAETEAKERIAYRLDLATNSAVIGIWDWDIVKNELAWDTRMYLLYGLQPKDFSCVYDAWLSRLHPDDRNSTDHAIQLALKNEKDYDLEFRIIWPDESIHYTKANGKVLWDEIGNPIRMIGTNYDITEQKISAEKIRTINQELIEAINSKDKFFSIIAHDLRSPMNALLGITEILKEDYDELPKEEIKQWIDSLYDVGQGTFKLLENLLYWSRIQTGRLKYFPERINVYTKLHQTVKLMNNVATQKSISIKMNIDPNTFMIADPNMLDLIIRNLISNAIKFSFPNSEINLNAEEVMNKYLISVSDKGVGIEESSIEQLFKTDKLSTKLGTNKERGSGLGLMLCKEMMEMHNGEIKVISEIGKGSTFILSFPTGIYT